MKSISILLFIAIAANSTFAKDKKTAKVAVAEPMQESENLDTTSQNSTQVESALVQSSKVSPTFISTSPYSTLTRSLILSPDKGQQVAVNVSVSGLYLEYQRDNYKSENKVSLLTGIASYSYALSSAFFVGGTINYSKSKSTTRSQSTAYNYSDNDSYESKGSGEPTLVIGGHIGQTDSLSGLWAISRKFSLGDSERKNIDSDNAESDSKYGASVVPAIGINYKFDTYSVGALAEYVIRDSRKSKSTSTSSSVTTYKEEKGNSQSITAYFDQNDGKTIFGGLLNYTKIEPTKSTNENTGRVSDNNNDAVSFATITGYANFKAQDNLVLTPSLSYGEFGEGLSDLKTKNMVTLSLATVVSF